MEYLHDVKLNTQLYLALPLRMSGAIPPLPLCLSGLRKNNVIVFYVDICIFIEILIAAPVRNFSDVSAKRAVYEDSCRRNENAVHSTLDAPAPVLTGRRAHPAYCTMRIGSLSRG